MKKLAEEKKKGMGKMYAAAFATSIIMSFVLAYFVDYAGAKTVLEGAQVGFLSWLGFVATVTAGNILWEGKPGTSKRVAKGVNLPGYDSSSGGLKEFLEENYRLTPTELSRVMNDFRGGRKDRAMKFLSSRRKESAA